MSPSTIPTSDGGEESSSTAPRPPKILIVGGGMGGLVLALALRRHLPRDALTIDVYEQAREFSEGTGGAIGMYPNGLRVLRDIDPDLLSAVRDAGYPYIYRRWMRHDGTTVAVAEERHLTPSGREDDELAPLGIRRWRLQKVLYDACVDAGITVHFDKRVERVEILEDEADASSAVMCSFADGTSEWCDLLFGADGVKSKVREFVVGSSSSTHEPEYTGVTCLMGAADDLPRPVRGICFPSSSTTKCHECTYPTGPNEQVFQIYFPTPVENPESWGTLDDDEGRRECTALAERLERDGWADEFLAPLRRPVSVVRVGLRTRDPLDNWIGGGGRVVLLGDAAHPAVPYIGQGAQMAIEDAGVLALLMNHYCCRRPLSASEGHGSESDGDGGGDGFTLDNVDEVLRVYESIRIPRTREILGSSRALGATQQRRADSWWYNLTREWSIRWQVLVHGTLPVMKPGATYDYREDVERVLREESDPKAISETPA